MKRKNLRNVIALFVSVIMLGGALAGCGGSSGGSPAAETAKDPIILRLALETNPGSARNNACEEWVRLIEQYTNGEVKVEIYPSAQLGQPNEVFEGLKMGSVDLTVQGSGQAGSMVPAFNVIFLPYRWSSQEHLEKFIVSEAYAEMMVKPLEDQGIKYINAWPRAPRHLATRGATVTTPSDLRGVKLRVPDTIASFEAWKAVGANPQPIAWGEVYSGLQQGVVDACEAPMESLASISIQEVCKELILTAHVLDEEVVLMSQIAYNKLTTEQQKAVYKAADEARVWAADRAEAEEQKYIEQFKEAGVNVTTPDVDSFIAATADVVKRLTEEIAPGMDEIIVSMK